MQLVTCVSGFSLVSTEQYDTALHTLLRVVEQMKPVRQALLHDMRILEQQSQNSFAKTIRLMDKLHKIIDEAEGVKL